MQMGLYGGQADKLGRDNEASREDEHASPKKQLTLLLSSRQSASLRIPIGPPAVQVHQGCH